MDRQHGLPVVNHLLQHTLRSICSISNSSNSSSDVQSQWVYAVFWRILPRNYPPPKWDTDNGFLDRSKGNKRNWILTWEDGFCDFAACAKSLNGEISDCNSNSLQPELFFKMSHEVYNYGEGLMGKVASDSSHKWIHKDLSDSDPSVLSPWHGSLDPHPRTWESQFKAGIQTIAIIAVQEGLLQLGSLEKVFEDLNFVIMLQRKFTCLQNIPGVFALHPHMQNNYMRPRVPLTRGYTFDDAFLEQKVSLINFGFPASNRTFGDHHQETASPSTHLERRHSFSSQFSNQQVVGTKRRSESEPSSPQDHNTVTDSNSGSWYNGRTIPERPAPSKSLNTGNSPPGVVSLHPSMSSLHALLSKLPSISSTEATSSPVATRNNPNTLCRITGNNFSSSRPSLTTATETEELEPNLSCKTSASTTSRIGSKEKLCQFGEGFDNMSEFSIHSEFEAYNSFLSEIIN